MRWMFRFVILGLAGFGAYQLYQLLQPKAVAVRDQAGDQINQAKDTARAVAGDVRDDVLRARDAVAQDVRDELREAGYSDVVSDDDVRTAQ